MLPVRTISELRDNLKLIAQKCKLFNAKVVLVGDSGRSGASSDPSVPGRKGEVEERWAKETENIEEREMGEVSAKRGQKAQAEDGCSG